MRFKRFPSGAFCQRLLLCCWTGGHSYIAKSNCEHFLTTREADTRMAISQPDKKQYIGERQSSAPGYFDAVGLCRRKASLRWEELGCPGPLGGPCRIRTCDLLIKRLTVREGISAAYLPPRIRKSLPYPPGFCGLHGRVLEGCCPHSPQPAARAEGGAMTQALGIGAHSTAVGPRGQAAFDARNAERSEASELRWTLDKQERV